MPGLMGDNDIQGQFEDLLSLFLSDTWREVWDSLNLTIETFESLGLSRDVSDLVLWQTCQNRQVVLVTGNRNGEGPDSLEAVLQKWHDPRRLPVFTLAQPKRVRRSKAYAERVAERLLDYLLDLDNYRGVGRLYLP